MFVYVWVWMCYSLAAGGVATFGVKGDMFISNVCLGKGGYPLEQSGSKRQRHANEKQIKPCDTQHSNRKCSTSTCMLTQVTRNVFLQQILIYKYRIEQIHFPPSSPLIYTILACGWQYTGGTYWTQHTSYQMSGETFAPWWCVVCCMWMFCVYVRRYGGTS